MEEELKVSLFDRVGKKVSLNSNGEIALKYATKVFQILEDMRQELIDNNTLRNSTVTIFMLAGSKLLPSLITYFKRQYPNIFIKLLLRNSMYSESDDCDITIYASAEPPQDTNTVQLIKENILLGLPASSPFAACKNIRLSDLAQEEIISLQSGHPLREIMDYYCKAAGFSPNIVLETDSPETMRGLIHAGMGIAFIPEITWPDLKDSFVTTLPIVEPKCVRYINMSYQQNRYISEAALVFGRCVQSFFSMLEKSVIHPLSNDASSPISNFETVSFEAGYIKQI